MSLPPHLLITRFNAYIYARKTNIAQISYMKVRFCAALAYDAEAKKNESVDFILRLHPQLILHGH